MSLLSDVFTSKSFKENNSYITVYGKKVISDVKVLYNVNSDLTVTEPCSKYKVI